MKSILITGINGQLGHELKGLSYTHTYKQYNYLYTDIENLDITDQDKVEQFFNNNQVDCIINCAAYTNVDKAESETEKAMLVNGLAVKWLVNAARKNNAGFIHVSTDYVFDGTNHIPYKEEDPANPVTAYGKTKFAGEEAVLQYLNGTVVRTSWLYSPQGNNFLTTILKRGAERNELNVVNDQVGTPTYARDLAKVLLSLADNVLSENNLYNGGLFHYSNEGVCSWYDFALEIVKLTGLHCRVNPVDSSQYPSAARRPHYSVMNKNKIKTELSVTIPYWKDSLISCIDQLDQK